MAVAEFVTAQAGKTGLVHQADVEKVRFPTGEAIAVNSTAVKVPFSPRKWSLKQTEKPQ